MATDDNEIKKEDEAIKEGNDESRKSRKHVKQILDSEFGVVRGIDNIHKLLLINGKRKKKS